MNIEEKINELQKQIIERNEIVDQQMLELQKLLLEHKNKVKEKSLHELIIGERKRNDTYYLIDNISNKIIKYFDNNDFTDKRLYENFNYFQDKNEAERYQRLTYLNTKMIRVRNYLNNGWFPIDFEYCVITLLFNDKESYCVVDGINSNTSPLFFKNCVKAQEFENLVDKKEMIEYLQLMEGYMPNA